MTLLQSVCAYWAAAEAHRVAVTECLKGMIGQSVVIDTRAPPPPLPAGRPPYLTAPEIDQLSEPPPMPTFVKLKEAEAAMVKLADAGDPKDPLVMALRAFVEINNTIDPPYRPAVPSEAKDAEERQQYRRDVSARLRAYVQS